MKGKGWEGLPSVLTVPNLPLHHYLAVLKTSAWKKAGKFRLSY